MGKILGQIHASDLQTENELGNIAQIIGKKNAERVKKAIESKAAVTEEAKKVPDQVQKVREFNQKVGRYMQKLAPLRSHKNPEIQREAKRLHSAFMQKKKELQALLRSGPASPPPPTPGHGLLRPAPRLT